MVEVARLQFAGPGRNHAHQLPRAIHDQAVIDGAVVNGSWKLIGWVAAVSRQLQSGYLYHYALVMILGVFALMTWFVWLK